MYVLPSQDANQNARPIIYLKFYTGGPPQAKRIWKNAVEQHTFFRWLIIILCAYYMYNLYRTIHGFNCLFWGDCKCLSYLLLITVY